MISIEAYLSMGVYKYPDYLLSLASLVGQDKASKIVTSGMIHWEDPNNHWGVFPANYVFCQVKDYSMHNELETVAQIDLRQQVYEEYSSWNLPVGVLRRLFHSECLANNGSGFLMISPDGDECSRAYMTHAELQLVLANMNCQEQEIRRKNIFQALKLKWSKKEETREFPISVYLEGCTGNVSYTRVFMTDSKALEDVDKIDQECSIDYIHENYIFSN